MLNRYFTDKMLDVLLHPEQWELVSAFTEPEVAPATQPRHQEWMRGNTHEHAHQEILLILRGEGYQGYRGHVYPCRPGSLFVFDAFETHDLNCPPWASEMDQLWIVIVRDHFVARLLPVRHGALSWPGEWNHLLSHEEAGMLGNRCLFGLRDEASLPGELTHLKIRAVVALLISALIRAGYREPVQEDRESFQYRIVATIQQHIQETAGKGVSLDSLARISGYSKFHFLRLFMHYTGQTVHDYINYCRLQRVKELQEHGHNKKEISATLGFSCQSAFSRWYKKWQAFG